jgi:RNAse (barnase) inhibitor barstar
MANLIEMLSNPKRCGVFRFSGDAGILEGQAAAAGLAVHKLDIGSIPGKNGLLDAFAATLKFPAYFGANWDALDECLSDLEWLDAPGWFLIIAGAGAFAAKNRQTLGTAIEMLQSAVEYWREEGKPFWVVILDAANSEFSELPQFPAA